MLLVERSYQLKTRSIFLYIYPICSTVFSIFQGHHIYFFTLSSGFGRDRAWRGWQGQWRQAFRITSASGKIVARRPSSVRRIIGLFWKAWPSGAKAETGAKSEAEERTVMLFPELRNCRNSPAICGCGVPFCIFS